MGRGGVLEFLWIVVVFGRSLWVSGLLSYHPGPISGSAFLWRWFCGQKPPCKFKSKTNHTIVSLDRGQGFHISGRALTLGPDGVVRPDLVCALARRLAAK